MAHTRPATAMAVLSLALSVSAGACALITGLSDYTLADGDGPGGAGGAGGAGAGGGAGGDAGGAGGSVVCMDTETGHCTDFTASSTNDCGTCSISTGGPCKPLLDKCLINPVCVELDDCQFQCPQGDTACSNACYTMYPEGVADYEAILHCIICETCPIECDAAMDPRCAT